MARLFLAVWPSDEVVEELRSLPRKDVARVRFVPPENWHVTLRFLGEADPDAVEEALDDALAGRPDGLPAAAAHYGPAVDVLGERVLALPVAGLDELAGVVRDATALVGEPESKRRFRGHLTLARLKVRGRQGPVRMPPALGMLVTATQVVEEVALVRSRLHPTGATYDTLATWPVPP